MNKNEEDARKRTMLKRKKGSDRVKGVKKGWKKKSEEESERETGKSEGLKA